MEGSMMAMEEKTLQINGMSCTACASSIEKGISKMDGVEEANVNFALERTSITYDPEKTNVDAFKQKIKDLGYDVVQEKAEFDITGMTCAACANRIEKRVNKMDGVETANVNFALENMSVVYDDTEVHPDDMMAVVKKLGFELLPKQSETEKLTHKQEDRKSTRLNSSHVAISYAVFYLKKKK